MSDDPRLAYLTGGLRTWWDWFEMRFVDFGLLYLPQGCPDWGERGGKRNDLCTFCALPNAVAAYRQEFYGGNAIPAEDHIDLFRQSLAQMMKGCPYLHTLGIFNAGSFLAEIANTPMVRDAVLKEIVRHSSIKNVVIESRAELITEKSLTPIVEILTNEGKRLTIRIGIETHDDNLRLRVLRKGHSRTQLKAARDVVEDFFEVHDVQIGLGGYALLNPAPGLNKEWAVAETIRTIDWILGCREEDLGMDEVYFCSTNVGLGTSLETSWRAGKFTPADPWMILSVLEQSASRHGKRVHLLPFKDEPEFLAVPSNHVADGLPQNLAGAAGCDLEFHAMFEKYRTSMDPRVLYEPSCSCRPSWF